MHLYFQKKTYFLWKDLIFFHVCITGIPGAKAFLHVLIKKLSEKLIFTNQGIIGFFSEFLPHRIQVTGTRTGK